jgi:hypothetical protein
MQAKLARCGPSIILMTAPIIPPRLRSAGF